MAAKYICTHKHTHTQTLAKSLYREISENAHGLRRDINQTIRQPKLAGGGGGMPVSMGVRVQVLGGA